MMPEKEIVIQGKTLKEARKLACKILNVEERLLKLEILDPGIRKYFGLIKRPVVIRAKAFVDTPNLENTGNVKRIQEEDRDGLIGVKEGKPHIIAPLGNGKRAMIIPSNAVQIKINGVLIKSAHQIFPEDVVEIETLKEVTPASLEITISKDGLAASIALTHRVVNAYEIIDQKPQSVLQIITKRRVESTPEFSVAHVKTALAEHVINYGINLEALENVVAVADGNPVIIARGDPSIEGQDGYVEYHFPRDSIPTLLKQEEKVNYWERFVYPSVQEGQVLAILHHQIEGKPGKKVTGEEIQPREVRPALLGVKDGVILSEDGCKAIAEIPGRPLLEGYKNPFLKIAQLMVHPGDVDIKSGNLHFHGDIIVLGNVHEGMQVVAKGDITVVGNTEGALLLAGGSVFCRGNLISSRVKASGIQVFYNKLIPQLTAFWEITDSLLPEMQVLEQQLTYRKGAVTDADRRKLFALLIARKKQKTTPVIDNFLVMIKNAGIPLPSIISDIVQGIEKLVAFSDNSDNNESTGPEGLVQFLKKREEFEKILHSLPNQPGDIICSYAQGSTLEASGNVIIEGQGCINCSILAGKRIKVWGTFRGGQAVAIEEILLEEAGTSGVSVGKTRMRVGVEGKISINRAFPEIQIHVGPKSYIIDEEQHYVRAALNTYGQLDVTSRTQERGKSI